MKLQKTQRVVFAILILVGMIFLCQDNATADSMIGAAVKKAATTQTQTGASQNTHSNSVIGAVGAAAGTALRTGASQNTHSHSMIGAVGAAAGTALRTGASQNTHSNSVIGALKNEFTNRAQ